MGARLSVIIPVLNEAVALPATLANCAARTAEMPAGSVEFVLVDGGSKDGSVQIAEAAGLSELRTISAPRGRGSQMNAGAAVANGEHLLFLHADTHLPEHAFPAIVKCLADHEAGCFMHRFSRGPNLKSRLLLGLIARLHNFRFRLSNIAYGDQALFMRAETFQEIGGFEHGELEDVWMGEAIRARSGTRLLPMKLVTDARKFIEFGELRALWWVAQIQWDVVRRQRIRRQNFFEAIR